MNITPQKILSGLKEGENNDWAPTVDGYVQMEYDINMLRQQINGRLQTLPNEVDGYDGIDYINVIFGNTSFEVKAQAFITAIKTLPLVKDVAFVGVSWVNKKDGIIQFVFSIQSTFGDLMFNLGLDTQQRTITTTESSQS